MQHSLKIKFNKSLQEETIFTRRGDALWDDVIGNDLALSPVVASYHLLAS
jgi:hypothetical protein